MSKKRTKPEIERFIFDEFVKLCPLKIISFESRTEPEPDILCKLESGEQIAFELTQLDDPEVIQKDQVESKLTQDLVAAKDKMTNADSFYGYGVHVRFFKGTFREWNSYIPVVIQTLNENGPVGNLPVKVKGQLVGTIHCTNHEFDIPVQLSVSSASHVGDYTLTTISKKFGKKYETKHPIHLLAWATSNWLVEVWRDDLTEAFKQQSIFDRIWVYDRIENAILYDSGS
jgi:hypothetical protein